ncbi:hypothetical protein ONZ45_g2405 [Pleurotus djamor]|nr:hypothetical protein ONZ45_g2405 [Pleurotus djamor]
MHPIFVSTLLFAALALASPANDWSKPCFEGECAYDSPDPKVSAVFKLRGHPKSITDITPAAGWVILDCDPHTLEQDIRLVCQSHDESGCEHMFSYHGPEDKLVRLPDSCGHGPFARIASAKVAEDQSIPDHMDHKVAKRDGVPPVVHIVTIDTNFAAIDMSKTGQVDMAFQGINLPNIDANFAFDDSHDFFGWLVDRIKELHNTISTGIQTIGTVFQHVAILNIPSIEFVGSIPDKLKNATAFDFKMDVVPTQTINLVGNNTQVLHIEHEPTNCEAKIGGALSVTLDGHAYAQVTIGVVMTGHVLPSPTIKDFHFAFDVNADINTKLNVAAHLHGTFQSKRIPVFELGIPMFSIPGFFELGPWVQLDLQAKAHLAVDFEVNLDIQYHVQHMRVWWPGREDDPEQQQMEMKDSQYPLTLSVDASVKANAIVEGHIIPSVKLGIKLGEKAQASAFIEADAHARLSLAVDADVQAHAKREFVALDSYLPPYGHNARDLTSRSMDHEASSSFTGCIWLTAGVAIAAGVEGTLGSLEAQARATIWKSQELDILDHCWHAGKDAHSQSRLTRPNFEFADKEGETTATCTTKKSPPALVNEWYRDRTKASSPYSHW